MQHSVKPLLCCLCALAGGYNVKGNTGREVMSAPFLPVLTTQEGKMSLSSLFSFLLTAAHLRLPPFFFLLQVKIRDQTPGQK